LNSNNKDTIEIFFLCQGCQSAESVAERLAQFISSATKTLDVCIYSFNLCDKVCDIVTQAIQERAKVGVTVRVAYDAGTQHDSVAEPDNDWCDISTPDFVASLGVPSKPIEGYRALMHDKYIIVDADTPDAKVLTGSTNFTDDSWALEENNIVILHSQKIASYYTHDFNDLWVDGNIAGSTEMDRADDILRYQGEPVHVMIHFAPIEGEWIDDNIASQVDRTRRQASLAVVVLTSGRILGALKGLMKRGMPLEGIYDETQMEGVKYQWQQIPANHWKIGAWDEIVDYGNLVGKISTPYTPESKHDFMHNKVMVLDDTVITGSYNFSRHAQANAENIVYMTSPAVAKTYRDYIHRIMTQYKGQDANASKAPRPEPVLPEAQQ
jgi:phosphatidylserine/phosphatidylglycerophosphate/cardiolipin synthase-like enzyme